MPTGHLLELSLRRVNQEENGRSFSSPKESGNPSVSLSHPHEGGWPPGDRIVCVFVTEEQRFLVNVTGRNSGMSQTGNTHKARQAADLFKTGARPGEGQLQRRTKKLRIVSSLK